MTATGLARMCMAILVTWVAAYTPCIAAEGGTGAYLPGFRNYRTGIVPPVPGLYFRDDLVVYSGGAPRVVYNGLPVSDISVDAVLNIIEPYYVLPHKVWGADHAIVVTHSLVHLELSGNIIGTDLRPSGSRLAPGDTFFSPFLLGWHEGNWHYNTNLAIFIPTGSYDIHRTVNTGLNYWALDPQFGLTYFDPRTGWDFSGAIGYTFNFENPDTNYDSGDVFHFDFAIGKLYKNGVKPGIVGYAWVQTTADSGEGAIFGPFRSRVFGIGPAIQWRTGKNSNLMFRYFHEFGAENHLEGEQFALAFRIQF